MNARRERRLQGALHAFDEPGVPRPVSARRSHSLHSLHSLNSIPSLGGSPARRSPLAHAASLTGSNNSLTGLEAAQRHALAVNDVSSYASSSHVATLAATNSSAPATSNDGMIHPHDSASQQARPGTRVRCVLHLLLGMH